MPVAVPPVLTAVAQRVEHRLADVLDSRRDLWVGLDADLEGPFAEIRRFVLGGGKRLRAAFCWEGFVGAGGDVDDRAIVDLCSAFELMHAFALFHDDVMDGAATRRGAPTTHVVYAEAHSEHRWAGEARRFGDGMAILIGDLTFVYADELVTSAIGDAGAGSEVWALWNQLRIELNVGQVLDLLGTAQRDRSVAKAARICRYKSAKYSIERPLHVGAALASPTGSARWRAAYSAYGLPLGDAFQLRDDVIGVFGDPSVTGKPVGDDLREGKPTPLLAAAVAAATGTQRAVLERVGESGLDDAEIADIQAVIVDTGALVEIEARISRLADSAVRALNGAPIAAPADVELVELAEYVVGRAS